MAGTVDREKAKRALAKLRADRDEAYQALRDIGDDNDRITAELATATGKLDETAGKARSAVHRAAFDRVAARHNVDPKHLDDLWKLADVDTSADGPDEDKLTRAVRAAVKSRPHVIKQATDDEGDESETDEGESETGDDDETEDAPARPAAKVKARARGDEAPGKGEPAPSDGKPLTKGAGAARGGRASAKPPTLADQVNEDYAATGRGDDSFRI